MVDTEVLSEAIRDLVLAEINMEKARVLSGLGVNPGAGVILLESDIKQARENLTEALRGLR